MGALSFGAPLVLVGLLALPAIWWLLRLTPPRPQTEAFPPLAILARVARAEETPAQSPWWLTLLRLLLAAAIVLALAAPVLNPRAAALSGGGPVAILMDNGWAAAPDWEERRTDAEALIREAGDAGRPVSLVLSAEGAADNAAPMEAGAALERLAAAEVRPVPVDRQAAAERLAGALSGSAGGSLVLLTDGLDAPGTAEALDRLSAVAPHETLLFADAPAGRIALTGADNSTGALVASGVRTSGQSALLSRTLRALDDQGREIARAPLSFEAGAASTQARFDIPVELRNEVARIEAEGVSDAAEVRLVDDSFQRRRVALVSGEASDLAQPLLSPLYYITRALEPFADLVRADSADLSIAIPRLLEQDPSIVVLADIGVLPDVARESLEAFVENGGTLLRFAGPRLAATTGEDTLVPVRLRGGERQLGGALSWSEPQRLAPMTEGSPFAGIEVPADVTVSRQVLAEPSAALAGATWASLADGTPIVTAAARGAGTIVLVHTTAEATWSNLPISGVFVDMLRRIVTLSRAGGAGEASRAVSLPPYRALDARGFLASPPADARPLTLEPGSVPRVTRENPPGLYGTPDGLYALNLMSGDATLDPFPTVGIAADAQARSYGGGDSRDLMPWLLGLALLFFALDAIALLWLNGAFSRMSRLAPRRSTGPAALILIAAVTLSTAEPRAQVLDDLGGIDMERALAATETTHLAYVLTGDAAKDEVSRQGLQGLSHFIAAKTALEPGDPMAVDIEMDELSFFPILYWPVDAGAEMPSAAAVSRIDAYMKQGGTVLFDVAGDAMSALGGNMVSDGQRRLRDILADLDIPPLEPVPADHVLTKAFYIMDEFPGRRAGSDLWVEASARGDGALEGRPASVGDGVSSIMITSNDLAGAWAVDDGGLFVYPTDTSDPRQREWAYRAGVNIVMYVLTGNYKADQVHVPAILERLGQ